MNAEVWAGWTVKVGLSYVVLGFIFAMAFVAKGVDTIDAASKNAGWGFRIMILPGATAFWPILAQKWLKTDAND
jgi:hypothetical protein